MEEGSMHWHDSMSAAGHSGISNTSGISGRSNGFCVRFSDTEGRLHHPGFASSAPNVHVTQCRPSLSGLRRSNSDGALADLEALCAKLDRLAQAENFGRKFGEKDKTVQPASFLREIRSLPARQDDRTHLQKKGKSVLGKLKGLVMRKSKSTGDLLENITYVCETSRMAGHGCEHHRHVLNQFLRGLSVTHRVCAAL
jgi:hypothetical protein